MQYPIKTDREYMVEALANPDNKPRYKKFFPNYPADPAADSFNDRFGGWQPDANGMRSDPDKNGLLDALRSINTETIVKPGTWQPDPLGHRGYRDPHSGLNWLKVY